VQPIEIVPFSKQILSPLDFRAPLLALFRQKTLDHVPEALYRDAQLVPGVRIGLLGPALVQIDDAGQLPENQLGQPTLVHGDEFRPGRQPARPALPSFARKGF
jgi:hypothetical protein